MSTHTPWVVRRDDSGNKPGLWSVIDATGAVVFFGLEEARARIFAAAPEMLAALRAQHDAIDTLLVMLIERDHSFRPTKSAVWPAVVQGAEAIAKAEGRQ